MDLVLVTQSPSEYPKQKDEYGERFMENISLGIYSKNTQKKIIFIWHFMSYFLWFDVNMVLHKRRCHQNIRQVLFFYLCSIEISVSII